MNNSATTLLILALTLVASALVVEGVRVDSAFNCPRGYGYCANYGTCCDLDYQCADPSQCFGGEPDSALYCPRGYGYCTGLGCCNLDFGCSDPSQCFGGGATVN